MRHLKILLILIFIGCAQNSPAQTVYTTKTGEKYHTASCHYLKHSKREIALEEAIKLGYQACSVCKPGSNMEQIQSFVSETGQSPTQQETAIQKTTATQCTGKTKAGTPCKRMTKNANGRCYQH